VSKFAAPAPQGDKLQAGEVLNHLLVIIPTEYIPSMPTVHGDSDAIRCDVAVLTQQTEAGTVPVYRDVLWFNVSLKNTLKKQVGDLVLSRMGQGTAKPGQDPAFILLDATTDAQAVQYAEHWLNTNPEFEAVARKKLAGAAGLAAPAAAPAPAVPTVPTVPAAVAPAPAASQPFAAGGPAPAVAPAPQAAAPAPAAPQITAQMLAALPPEEQAKLAALFQGQAG